MKILFDFLPIVFFFVAYQFGGGNYQWNGKIYVIEGIYAATAVIIATTIMQAIYSLLRYGQVEKSHVITLILVLVLGGATLWLHNPNFIKWKPTVVHWLFALTFAGAHLFTDKSLPERMMARHIQLPHMIWLRLSIIWIVFFAFSGIANLYVAFNFNEDTWVNFKLFGWAGLTVIFIIIQSIYLSKYIIETSNLSKDIY